ncbi:MAG: SMC-Scp complex subunit ScpB [Planctomycetota bacterium]|nr:SMC-Scp complex subunit ScpB [Planctomycetota bacterium]
MRQGFAYTVVPRHQGVGPKGSHLGLELPAAKGLNPQRDRSRQYWNFIHYLASTDRSEALEGAQEEEHPHGKLQRLEGVLFLSREGLSLRKLAKLAGLADATEARTLIRELNQQLDEQGRAFRVEDIAGGYALLTRAQFADWLRRFEYVPGQQKLSQTAMETLAVVAYRQPVPRSEIEAIRGVSSSEVLKQLMEYELVRIHSRSEELGRPFLYGTTRRFLQMFGLRSLDRLPRMSWVNEPLSAPSIAAVEHSETEDSAMTSTLSMDESVASINPAVDMDPIATSKSSAVALAHPTAAVEDEENDGFYEEEDEEEGDDFEDLDDDDWDDDEDEEESEDDLEEESEWEEVDDDDDGWSEDDDDDEEDDDWGEEEEKDDEDGDWD